jgi:bifunctional non-homologous end joining protein LigD
MQLPHARTRTRSKRVRTPDSARRSPAGRPALSFDWEKLPSGSPGFIEPMKALLKETLPQGPDWLYEVKFDGFRGLAIREGSQVTLLSRNDKALTSRYPNVAAALQQLPERQFVLDGELVAVDEEGRSSFQLMQGAQAPGQREPTLLYYVFDLLNFKGKVLTGLPLIERRALLANFLKTAPECIRYSPTLNGNPQELVRRMQELGMEGLVAKLKHARYEPGRRTGAWVKFKWNHEQEFVIGGFTPPKGGRAYFGALLVGYYQGDRLLFASKVGTGFDGKLLKELHARFQQLKRAECPFANLP